MTTGIVDADNQIRKEELDQLQVSKIIADNGNIGSDMKNCCRKRKLDPVVSSSSNDLQVSAPRTRLKKLDVYDGADTSSLSMSDTVHTDISEDADSCCNSCEYAEAASSATSPECHVLELPPSSADIAVPEESIINLFSVYSFLRSFSVQLFLSPFELNEFVGSLNCTVQNSLLDAIHLSLMRALWDHLQVLSSDGFVLASKCLSYYDWNLLDALTWPAFVVEYLYIMGYMRNLGGRGHAAVLLDGDYYCLPVTIKLKVLQILCDDVIDSAEFRTELAMRENIEDDVEGEFDVTLPLEDWPRNIESRACKNSVSHSTYDLRASEELPQKIPCSETRKADACASSTDIDGNSDECRLCGMDGTLICCDGCPFAYHSRCIGLNKAFLPDGPWFCPECAVDKLAPMRVARGIKGAEAFGIDMIGRLFLGTSNYLLVTGMSLNAKPFCRYYNQTDVTKVLSMMSSDGKVASLYVHICNEISKHWEIPISSLEAGPTKPVGGSSIFKDRGSNADVEAKAHSSLFNSSKQSRSRANSSAQDDTQIASKNTAETVHKVLPVFHARPSKQFGNESLMTIPSFTNLPSIAQRSTAPAISNCKSVSQNGNTCSSYVAIKNDAVNMLDRSTYGRQFPVVQGRNDRALNSRASFKPQSYVNHYIHGEIAASAAANLALLTNEDRESSEARTSSNSRKTVAASIALEMKAFSDSKMYFLWPTVEKKLIDIPRERCGWCIACKGTLTNRKGCLLNLVTTNAIKGSTRNINGLHLAKHGETHLSIIAAHIENMEWALHGLIVESFLDAESNLRWRKQLREASSCRILKILLLEFEKSIRRIAFSDGWFKLINNETDGPFKFSMASGGASHAGPNQKRGPGRPGRRSKKQLVSSETTTSLTKDSWKDVQWWRGGKLSKVILQYGTLPSSLSRKAARQGGSKRISSIYYPESVGLPRRSQQSAWRAVVQMCKNATQLALQVRYLDANIRWKDLIPPEQTSLDGKGSDVDILAFRNAVICDKRFAENIIVYAVTFSNQKHFPSRLMKNVFEKETVDDKNSRLWFSENNIPLYLIKEYEEKICGKVLPGLRLASHVRPKFQQKKLKSQWKDIFTYLMHKGDQPSRTYCASCREDVNLSDATTCSICQGKCHKDCAIPLIDRKGASLSYTITCKICYHAKTTALDASRKGIINNQLHLRR